MSKIELFEGQGYQDATQDKDKGAGFAIGKRGFDLLLSAALVPLLICVAMILWFVNPIWNPGPVFYVQKRMGLGCRAIRVVKFRTMRPAPRVRRSANDPLEVSRIPALGHLLRKSRLDELPQILNVLRGEMSLIGPRPDYFPHALAYLRDIPGYRARHTVRPGISGLAQVDLGYAEGMQATRAKVAADLTYLRTRCLRVEAVIFARTLAVILRGGGS